MTRRLEIELTSRTAEGGWTWRAAGAKQPRGTVEGSVVPEAAVVGDVLRAEVESGIEGFDIVAITPKPAREEQPTTNRIEVLGAPRDRGPDVSVTLAPGGRRRGEGPRRDGDDRRRRPGGEGRSGRPPRQGRQGPGEHRVRAGDDEGSEATDRAGRVGERRGGDRRGGERPGTGRGRPREEAGGRRDRRPAMSTAHRNALLAELGPERLPIAEQLLRGGIPAVRQAIEEQNARVKGLGGTPVNAEPVLAIAEELAPAVTLATWKDRATSAQAAGRELRLRELRAVVAGSRAVTLDEEGRGLAKVLRESLDQRVTALQDDWVGRMTVGLEEGRVVDAVHTAARPPEPAMRLPADLAVRLAEAAGAAMTAELDVAEWRALLEAVLEVADSSITYRSRYNLLPQLAAVADLILLDDKNPRAVLFQMHQLAQHFERLPQERNSVGREMLDHCVARLERGDTRELAGFRGPLDTSKTARLIQHTLRDLPKLSDAIAASYFAHSTISRTGRESAS